MGRVRGIASRYANVIGSVVVYVSLQGFKRDLSVCLSVPDLCESTDVRRNKTNKLDDRMTATHLH